MTGTGKIKMFHGGKPFFAAVEVTLVVGASGVRTACSGDGFTSQGHVEVVPSEGYEHWKCGGIAGAEFALRCAGATAAVTITRIAGLHTDTNPTTVAVGAARAVWSALKITPPEADEQALLILAFDSWNQPADAIPDLEELARLPPITRSDTPIATRDRDILAEESS
jgi:hypothetical protein